MLSGPPLRMARSTSWSAASSRSESSASVRPMVSSVTTSDRPSEHSRYLSPSRAVRSRRSGAAFTDRAGAMNGRFGGDMKDILGPIRGPDRDGFRGAIDGMHGPGHGVGFFGRPQGNGQQAEQTNQFHKALRVFRC